MRDIFSGNISRYRKDLDLTQKVLAGELGMTFQADSKWETGQTIPDTTLLPKLAQTLNISIDKLLGVLCLQRRYILLCGVLHSIKPELRDEVMANYKNHVSENDLVALHAFVRKPFIAHPPEKEVHSIYSYQWMSGQLFTCLYDWYLEHCSMFTEGFRFPY